MHSTLFKRDWSRQINDSTGNKEDIKSAKIGGIVIEGTRVNKIKNRTQICPVQGVHICQGAHTPAAASRTKGTVSPKLFNFGSNERKRWHFH